MYVSLLNKNSRGDIKILRGVPDYELWCSELDNYLCMKYNKRCMI